MRVSVLINPKAGTVNPELIEEKIREALFRCNLHICISKDARSMNDFIRIEIANKTDVLVICGGDGTVNASIQSLMNNKKKGVKTPPICLICSGTANDLAHEIGISKKIDEAARLILEGREKNIDVIEVESKGESKYMITNGGIGIPAETAHRANKLRSLLQNFATRKDLDFVTHTVSDVAHKLVKKMGPTVYSAMLLDSLREWQQKDWELEVEIPKEKLKFSTKAPFILVNNQPALAQKFITAPYTAHNDGQVNLLILEGSNIISQLEKVVHVYRGTLREGSSVRSFEIPEFSLKTKNKDRKLTFFGDGEVLFKDVEDIKVRCLKQSLTVMVRE